MTSKAQTVSTGSRSLALSVRPQRTWKGAILGATALTPMLFASSGALAQNCTPFNSLIGNLSGFGGFTSAASGSIASSIASVNTAFLGQQGSAFVVSPGGAEPNQQSGGVWVRGVAGEVDVKSTSTSNITFSSPTFPPAPPGVTQTGTVNCSSQERASFGGLQVGTDIARLNMDGWNVIVGTTAGYLESRSRQLNATAGLPTSPTTNFEVPFLGGYVVVTKGGFFADVMVRGEFYNINLNNPGADFFNQPFNARGISVTPSAGYHATLSNNWFIEPSAGISWSRTQVDPFNAVGLPGGQSFSGTVAVNDIKSELGRASVRVGTSFTSGNMAWQPFFTASVFHEFAGNVTSTYQTCPNCVFLAGGGNIAPASINVQSSSTRVGTYGQFSLGLAGQVVNTGWVGFVRGDYRTGNNLEGWTANAGLRYNFTPEQKAAAVVHKRVITKAPPPAVVQAVDWTGFYVGGFFGADYGSSRITFVDGTRSNPRLAGYIGGGQAGYNYQLGQYVFGVEGDVGTTNKHGAKPCGSATGIIPFPVPGFGGPSGAFSPFFFTCSNDLDWVATLAGRAGVTSERALFYVKAGGAWTHATFTASCIAGPNNGIDRSCFSPAGGVLTNTFGANSNRFGALVGWGTEYALTQNWSAKAEYNYIDFGRDTLRLTDGTLMTDRTTINEVKVGVNYRFAKN